MLSYEIREESLRFAWIDDETVDGYRFRMIPLPACVARESLEPIAQSIKNLCLGGAVTSYGSRFRAARYMVDFAESEGREFPPDPLHWQEFLISHYSHHLSLEKLDFRTRIHHWAGVAFLYKKFQRDKIIPSECYIPEETISGVVTPESEASSPLGVTRKPTSIPTTIEHLLPKKYLIEDGLSLTDDVYLLRLRDQLQQRSAVASECFLDYWERMLTCHSKGKAIIEKIPIESIERVLESGDFIKNGKHIAHPNVEGGMDWFLAVANYYFNHTDTLEHLTFKSLKKIPFFKGVIHNSHSRPLITEKLWKIAGEDGVENKVVNENLNRLIGNLSPRDCAVASAIIVTENPSFNPTSISKVRLYTKNGRSFLRGNSDTKRITLSVDKPRAGERKISVLPSLSVQVVTEVIRCTSVIRGKLFRAGRSGWRKLFLVSTRNQIGSNPDFAKALSPNKGVCFYDIYKEKLKVCGITPNMMNLYRIRCTQGIMEFLHTGSIQAVADKLGNSVQVVRSNYIPIWMEWRWRTRLLRIVHQKIIISATEGFPWQLEASDFTTREELESFVRKVLLALNKGDALSEVIRTRLGHYAADQNSLIQMFLDRELLLDLTPQSIAAVYAYAEKIQELPESEQRRINPDTDIPLWVFPALRQLITHTANLNFATATKAESAIADKIAEDSISTLKRSHTMALELLKNLRPLVRSFSASMRRSA